MLDIKEMKGTETRQEKQGKHVVEIQLVIFSSVMMMLLPLAKSTSAHPVVLMHIALNSPGQPY